MSNLVSVPKNGSLSKTNSNKNFPPMSNWFDELFNNDFPTVFSSHYKTETTLPKVNILEEADCFTIDMAVPGLNKSDFHIDVDNQILSIATKTTSESEQKEDRYTRKEFSYSAFKRQFNLPESVNSDAIKAEYTDGILHLHLPKKEEAKQKPARTIEIS